MSTRRGRRPRGSGAARLALVVAALVVSGVRADAQAERLASRAVVLIVTDGLRWQEVFGGADAALLTREHGGVRDTLAARRQFWRATAADRRRVLLPFFWGVIARDGQLFGNKTRESSVRVSNGLNFSYPGYNEMLTGSADPRIDRNDFGPNPNVTVFEWLARSPRFRGRVAAFGTWDVFDEIFARDRSGVFIHAGWEPPATGRLTPRQEVLAELYRSTMRVWDDVAYDAFMQAVVLDYVRTKRPAVLFVGYGETDVWAHDGRYDQMLLSAQRLDRFIAELWRVMQSMPEYRGRTTFIITTDHGRGAGLTEWKNHGRTTAGSEDMWIAVIGPNTPALGERVRAAPVTQSQIAATVAALLGEDYQRAAPSAAPPLADVISKRGFR